MAVVGWGSTFGPIHQAVRALREEGHAVSQIHIRYLKPFPRNLGELLKRFDRIVVPEMNNGQLVTVLRAEYLVPAEKLTKVTGKPFKISRARRRAAHPTGGDNHDYHSPPGPEGLKPSDFESDQEVRWCPGCGDYAILKAVQRTLAEIGARRGEDRLRLGHRLLVAIPLLRLHLRVPHHSRAGPRHRHRPQARQSRSRRLARHGRRRRALASAAITCSTSSAGTSNLQVMLFNNEIYGLTKGQYSPTSRVGTRSPSTPLGSVDMPVSADPVRPRRRRPVRGSVAVDTQHAPSDRHPQAGARAPGHQLRRDLPELRGVQRRGLRRVHRPGRCLGAAARGRAREAADLREGKEQEASGSGPAPSKWKSSPSARTE